MRSRSPFRAITGGIFFLFLALAFLVSQLSGHLFLPVLFVGLAFSALLGSLSIMNPRGAYGGIMGFIWFLGLAFCFLVGFWPWILVVIALSMIVGALARPIMGGLLGLGFMSMLNGQQPQQPIYQPPPQAPYQPTYQPPAQDYQQGYQPPVAQGEGYQEGGNQYQYPPQSQSYEQPQAQYPQEMPPQQ
jgi:hypothetical protein